MEAAGVAQTTESATIADLLTRSVELYGDRVAQKHKVDGEWRDITFAEVGEVASEIARGLIDLGVDPGARVSMLCTTRVEWAWCSFAISSAAAVVVPIYPTSSPRECEWVLSNSGARAVFCESPEQRAKIDQVSGGLPDTVKTIGIDADAGEMTLAELRDRGRGGDRAALHARQDAVAAGDIYTIIYTSGTTGPPKGVVLTHGNAMSVCTMV